jgi:tetratricopeptide (TPR) repeat protein
MKFRLTPRRGHIACFSGMLATLLCFVSVFTIDGAEVVYRRSDPNTKLSGAVQEISPKGIRLKTSKGEVVTIPADDIRQIQWEGEPILLRNARNADLAERNSIALEGYRAALQEIPEDQNQKKFREEAEFGIGRCLARLAATDAGKIQEALTELNRFAESYAESVHSYDVLLQSADLALLGNQPETALQNYRTLKASGVGTYPLLGELGLARIALAQGDTGAARKSLQAVLDSPLKGPLVGRRQSQARMDLAQILLNENQPAEAVKLAGEVIESSPPDDAQALARAYLMRGNSHMKQGNLKPALFDYLHVDLLFSQESAAHAEALYHLSSLWSSLQHPDRGAEARERLTAQYPESEWARKN